ncbi:MAG: FAD-dependent oxidoreductase [Hyphomicrobiaceae bacterium]
MTAEAVDLAIVGAGPAGLSAAREAVRSGVKRVVVLEREAEAGGTVRHCGHTGFGMLDLKRLATGPRYAALLRELSRHLDIRTGHQVTAIEQGPSLAVSTPEGPRRIAARAVLVATGIREAPRAARLVSGGRPFGILTTGALQRFVYLNGRLPCRRPIVVGSELVAFSSILTLRHGGVRPLAILAEGRRAEAMAPVPQLARLLYGVPVLRRARPLRIEGREIVTGLTIEREGHRETLDCDAVVFTGRWVPEASLLRAHDVGIDPATGGPRVDARLCTSDPAIYAAGNVRFGVRASGRCALEGRAAGRQIAADLAREAPHWRTKR